MQCNISDQVLYNLVVFVSASMGLENKVSFRFVKNSDWSFDQNDLQNRVNEKPFNPYIRIVMYDLNKHETAGSAQSVTGLS